MQTIDKLSLLGQPCLHRCSHYVYVACRGRIFPGVGVTGIFSHTVSWCFCVSLTLLWVARHATGTRSVEARCLVALANAIDPNVSYGYSRNGTGVSEDEAQASTITSHPINPSCRTGNCTFAPYTPLAVRRQCSDVTMSVSSTIQIGPMDRVLSLYHSTP